MLHPNAVNLWKVISILTKQSVKHVPQGVLNVRKQPNVSDARPTTICILTVSVTVNVLLVSSIIMMD